MSVRAGIFQLPSFRRGLIRVHKDLFTIHDHMPYYVSEEPLTEIEIMVLILEDRRFFRHNGFDAIACIREAAKFLTRFRSGGASTIDMQFVRTATGYRERTLRRKLYEILLSILIQFRYAKIEILRAYLSCAFFGSGLYGMSNASFAAFGKHPDSLNRREAAELAAFLVYPKPLTITPEWLSKVRRRSNYAQQFYARYKKKFEKLPRWELL